jgi:predicted acyl esterase
LRGNIEAYVRSASKNKKMQVHIGGHTDAFYSDEGKHEMLRWYDYWLKGKDTGIMDEPPVKLCVRTSVDECDWRFENEWPLERTRYTKYYLGQQDAGAVDDAMHDLSLSLTPPKAGNEIVFPSGPEAYERGQDGRPTVTFVTEPLAGDVEVTGHINLVMWVSSETDDMDVFAYLRDMAPDGSVETATRGVLKVSHRKLDATLSKPYLPYHTHDEEQKLDPGQIVPIEVEIWATSMVFEKGHRIRLDVQPHDGDHYFAAYKLGNNSIYTGGDRASYVLLPIIPQRK